MLAPQQQQRHLAASRFSSSSSSRTAAAVRLVPVTRHYSSVQLRAIEEKRDTAGSEASSSPVRRQHQHTAAHPPPQHTQLCYAHTAASVAAAEPAGVTGHDVL